MGILLKDLVKTLRQGDVPYLKRLIEQIQWHSKQEQNHAKANERLGRTLHFLASASYDDNASMLVGSIHQERDYHSQQELLHSQCRRALEQTRNDFISEVYKIDAVKQNWQIDFETNTMYRLPDASYFSVKALAKKVVETMKDAILLQSLEQGEPIHDD